MFKKPKKKRHFPPGTFIPTKARVLAIIQLCIAFSVICYNLGAPFLGEVFEVRQQQALYQSVMDSSLFYELSGSEQDAIMEGYQGLLEFGNRGFWEKVADATQVFFVDMPPFKLAWVFLSVIVPIMLLKKVEGARLAVWLIPLVTVLYALDSVLFYPEQPISKEEQLFPREEYLVGRYLNEPLNADISVQQGELKKAWNRYLVAEWADGGEVRHGAFAFNLARLEARKLDREATPRYEWKQSLLVLLLYVGWNVYFAFNVTRSLYRNKSFN